MLGSRERFLELQFATLKWDMAQKALELVREEMCKEKGFVRHNGSNYYHHLVDVAQELLNWGNRNEDLVTAALLHDLAEDVEGYTITTIASLFNPRVAYLVDLVTKKKGIDYKIEENLIEYLDRIEKDVDAALLKTADRVHNFGTLRDAQKTKKLKQVNETEKFFIPFFKRCRNMYPKYSGIFFGAKTTVEPLLWEIQEHYEDVEKLEQENKLLTETNQVLENEKEKLEEEIKELKKKLGM